MKCKYDTTSRVGDYLLAKGTPFLPTELRRLVQSVLMDSDLSDR